MTLTKTDKETIFNLLKLSDSYILGFQREKFLKTPVFFDDNTSHSTEEKNLENTKNITDKTETSKTSSITLEELNSKMLRCTRCNLARTRNSVVVGDGVENPLVLVVGEAPGAEEDLKGLPFVGKEGILLDKMLSAISLSRKTNCYIINTVKCRPLENRKSQKDEEEACHSFLESQIHILKPKMILCMGKVAAENLLKRNFSIKELHGQFFNYQTIPLLATYHPSALLRDESLKRPAWEDLKIFKRELDRLCSTSR